MYMHVYTVYILLYITVCEQPALCLSGCTYVCLRSTCVFVCLCVFPAEWRLIRSYWRKLLTGATGLTSAKGRVLDITASACGDGSVSGCEVCLRGALGVSVLEEKRGADRPITASSPPDLLTV